MSNENGPLYDRKKALTPSERIRCAVGHYCDGVPIDVLAEILGTNQGRVMEACNVVLAAVTTEYDNLKNRKKAQAAAAATPPTHWVAIIPICSAVSSSFGKETTTGARFAGEKVVIRRWALVRSCRYSSLMS